MNYRYISILLLILIVCLTSSTIHAEDNLTVADADLESDELIEADIVEDNGDISDDDILDCSEDILSQEDSAADILSDSEVGTFKDLANEISSANNVLNLDKDYKYVSSSDSSYSSGISISKTLTINGNGYTIDGSNMARIFRVTGSNVVLNNITFTNPYRYNDGSAIYATGSYFKVYLRGARTP